jgi:hypothetical protein
MARYQSNEIVYSKGISHIIKNSTGIYTVYFLDALTNSNYYIHISSIQNSTPTHKIIEIILDANYGVTGTISQSINGFSFYCRNNSDFVDGNFYIIVYN